MRPRIFALLILLSCTAVMGGGNGGKAEYVGGTIEEIPAGCGGSLQAVDTTYFVFSSHKASWRVAYDQINLLEYGLKVDRRIMAAVLISPLFLLSKKRQHYLTVGYQDEQGKQQAMIFRVGKDDIRATLASLEARTGRRIEFQDDEARRAGRS